jgi:hypothetical protein
MEEDSAAGAVTLAAAALRETGDDAIYRRRA